MSGSERSRELRRRRNRRKKLVKLAAKVKSAKPSEIAVIKDKVRRLTPGSEQIFANWGLEEK